MYPSAQLAQGRPGPSDDNNDVNDTFDDIFFQLLAGLGENSTIKQLDIRLTGVAKQVKS